MKGLLLKDWYQVKTNMRMMYLTVLAVLAAVSGRYLAAAGIL